MASLRQSVLARGSKRFSPGACNDCTLVKWTKYFENEQEVYVKGNKFHVYTTGNTGPLLFLIHGGGYSALTWSLFTEEITNKIECQVMAIDLRGHGNTITDNEDNLSLDILAEDIIDIIDALFDNIIPPIVLVGHSLGGAVAVAAAALIPDVVGLCVIDVVEGTALESLSSMQSILRGRPSNFKSIEHAIQWSFRGGQTHNLEAARVSMPGQIKNSQTGQLAANEDDNSVVKESSSTQQKTHVRLVHQRSADAIEEENEEDDIQYSEENENGSVENDDEDVVSGPDRSNAITDYGKPPVHNLSGVAPPAFKVPSVESSAYTWRIDLSKTEPFWNGWFKGLSQKFLDIQVPKVLLLANIHGLDTALTVGQMQGKFQLQVLPRSGHAIHEDQPHNVADIIAGFLVKQKLAISRNGFTPTMPAC